ncbi:MAG: PilZ domain-containing protein [Nitrospira sp.]|nr:PilZ domain-containing protein [Nitrospira sp.]
MGIATQGLTAVMYADVAKELRRSERVTVSCHLTYSGFTENLLIVGEGTAIDISQEGVGIEGNQPVELGMRLTLCLALPDDEGPLFIDEVRVVWIKGSRFGVESVLIDPRSRLRLDHFLLSKKLNAPAGHERICLRLKM